jgi:hypothetical protein
MTAMPLSELQKQHRTVTTQQQQIVQQTEQIADLTSRLERLEKIMATKADEKRVNRRD